VVARPLLAVLLAGTAFLAAACSEYLALPEAPAVSPGAASCPSTTPLGPWVLAGDPAAVPHVWAIGPDGTRHEIAWPPGFKSVFWPDLVVLDQDSKKVGHGGDDLTNPPESFAGLVVCFDGTGATVRREADVTR
jgi:hypothetical protein